MDQRVIDLYDEFTHAPLDRRVFMERLAVLTGSTVAAEAALQLLAPNYALAAIVAENDPRVETVVSTDAASGLKTYTAAPKANKDVAAKSLVIVVHENRGLNPHIQDIARRLAIAGFTGVAVDMLTPMGGTPADEDQARDMFPKLDLTKGIASLVAMIDDRKKKDPDIKIGALGFCWGGSMVNALAAAAPNLDAAVVFYGVSPRSEAAANIKAKMLLHYAGLDKRINDTVPPFEEALKKARVKYEMFTYDNVNHAFHNDTTKERYAEAAAKLAWSRTTEFLRTTLR
jgi:carboxymethylenebutenolidase